MQFALNGLKCLVINLSISISALQAYYNVLEQLWF